MSALPLYRCDACGQSRRKWDRTCEGCGVAFDGVRCLRCSYKGGPNEFRSDICPRCGHHHENRDEPGGPTDRARAMKYLCSACGAAATRDDYWCPNCRTCLAGVQCGSCGYDGRREEFINDRCPRCQVRMPGAPR
jgi:hypothetical protein